MDTDENREDASTAVSESLPRARRSRVLRRTLLLLFSVPFIFLAWEVNCASREATVAEKFERRGRVSIDREERRPQWFWGLLGKRLANKVVSIDIGDLENAKADLPYLPNLREVRADITPENAMAVIPYLKRLPKLTEVKVCCQDPDMEDLKRFQQRRDNLEAIFRREMPSVKVTVSVDIWE
jgi:hypothetical protein